MLPPTRLVSFPSPFDATTHFGRQRQRTRNLLVEVRLVVFAAPTIKLSLKGVVGLVIYLLGVAIYLKDMAFGAALMIVGFVIDLLGVAFHDLRLVLEFRLP